MKSPTMTPAREKTSTKKPFTKAETTDTTRTITISRSAKFILPVPKARGRSANLTPAHIFPASCVPHFLGAPARAAAYSNPLPPDSRAQIACRTKAAPLQDDILRWAKSEKSLASTPRLPARCLSRSVQIQIWYRPESGPAHVHEQMLWHRSRGSAGAGPLHGYRQRAPPSGR